MVDLQIHALQMFHAANFKGKPPKMKPTRRPGENTPAEKAGVTENALSYLESFSPNAAAEDRAVAINAWKNAVDKETVEAVFLGKSTNK